MESVLKSKLHKHPIVWLAIVVLAATAVAEPDWVTGITEPIRVETYGAVVSGRLAAIHVAEGERVKDGQELASLDSTIQKLEVARRLLILNDKTELESARHRAASKQSEFEVARQKLILAATDELDAAKKQAALAERDLAATRGLYEKTQSVSKDELDLKELQFAIATAEVSRLENVEKLQRIELDAALDQLTLAKALLQAQVASLEHQEQREQIEYDAALEQLAVRQVKSSFGGVVQKIYLEPGAFCSAGQPLVDVVDVSEMRFVVNVEAARTANLRVEQKLQLEFDIGSKRIARTGRLIFLSPTVDAASGLREVKVLVPNADGAVWPGITGRMALSPILPE